MLLFLIGFAYGGMTVRLRWIAAGSCLTYDRRRGDDRQTTGTRTTERDLSNGERCENVKNREDGSLHLDIASVVIKGSFL